MLINQHIIIRTTIDGKRIEEESNVARIRDWEAAGLCCGTSQSRRNSNRGKLMNRLYCRIIELRKRGYSPQSIATATGASMLIVEYVLRRELFDEVKQELKKTG